MYDNVFDDTMRWIHILQVARINHTLKSALATVIESREYWAVPSWVEIQEEASCNSDVQLALDKLLMLYELSGEGPAGITIIKQAVVAHPRKLSAIWTCGSATSS